MWSYSWHYGLRTSALRLRSVLELTQNPANARGDGNTRYLSGSAFLAELSGQ